MIATIPRLLSDVGVAIIVAATLAFAARAFRQPLILAYVAAGVLLGESVGFEVITDPASVEAIASLGLILLLFLIGLEIDLQGIRRSGRAVFVVGLLQLPLNLALCWAVPVVLEATGAAGALGPYAGLYVAFALSLSSTLVVVKLLYDKQELDTLPGRITLGVLVIQDLWAILFLAVQPSLSAPELTPLLRSLGAGVGLVVGALVVARWVLPWVFRSAAKVPELVLLGALAWCFLVAGLASLAGLSAESGALVAGASLSVLPYRPDVVAKVTTVRDFFLTLFFVALGLKVAQPGVSDVVAAVSVAAFVLVTRFLVVVPLMRVLGMGDRVAIVTSINLWPISEFALVLCTIGASLGHITGGALQVVLFAMIVSAVGGTYLITGSDAVQRRLAAWLGRIAKPRASPAEEAAARHARPLVLLGFHRTASALLAELKRAHPDLLDQVLVVDFNPSVLEALKQRGVAASYGDLAHPDSLHHAGIHGCKVALCSIPDSLLKGTTNLRILEALKTLLPDAKVVVTAENRVAELRLLAAGAAAVLVPARAAGKGALEDVLALLDGRTAPSLERAGDAASEVLST